MVVRYLAVSILWHLKSQFRLGFLLDDIFNDGAVKFAVFFFLSAAR
jgi:hypothetical protein